MLSLFGEEQAHHPARIIPVGRRPEQHVHGDAFSDPHHTGRRIIARMGTIEPVAFIDQHGRKHLGRKIHLGISSHKVGDFLDLPSEIVGQADPGMRTAVAHCHKYIPLLQTNDGVIDDFIPYVHLGFGVIPDDPVPDHDHHGIVILDQLGGLVMNEVDNGKCGIGDAPDGAHRQRGRDGGYALLDGNPRRHHSGNDTGSQSR